MPAVDKPTKTYAEWCAYHKFDPNDPRNQSRYSTYRQTNDAALAQLGIYQGVWKEGSAAGAENNARFGGNLITAVSSNEEIRKKYNFVAYKSKGTQIQKPSPLKLSSSGYYLAEIAAWREWFTAYNAGNYDSDTNRRKFRQKWEAVVSPIIAEWNKAESGRGGDVGAKIIERAPLFSRFFKQKLEVSRAADPGLSSAVAGALGLGPRVVKPPAGAGGVAGAATTTPWGTYVVIGLVIVALAVGAYFIFRE